MGKNIENMLSNKKTSNQFLKYVSSVPGPVDFLSDPDLGLGDRIRADRIRILGQSC